jgi:hypothetical protein
LQIRAAPRDDLKGTGERYCAEDIMLTRTSSELHQDPIESAIRKEVEIRYGERRAKVSTKIPGYIVDSFTPSTNDKVY